MEIPAYRPPPTGEAPADRRPAPATGHRRRQFSGDAPAKLRRDFPAKTFSGPFFDPIVSSATVRENRGIQECIPIDDEELRPPATTDRRPTARSDRRPAHGPTPPITRRRPRLLPGSDSDGSSFPASDSLLPPDADVPSPAIGSSATALLRFGDFPAALYDIDGLAFEFGSHGFDELDDPSPTPKVPSLEMSKNPLSSILDQNRLTGSNYQDWIRSLKLVLTLDDLVYVLTEVPPDSLPPTATEADLAKLVKWKKDDVTARCYMIASMIPEMQRKYETFEHASDIARHLESCYSENMRASRYAATRELVTMRLREGASVHEHGLKMMTLLEKLVNLEVVLPHQLSVDLILLSLPSSYEPFIVNYNMNKLEPPMDELLNMLVSFESTIRKEKPVLLVAPGRKSLSPKKRKSFALGKRFEKGDTNGVKKDKVSKQVADVCHFCGKAGHWRRNCTAYLNQKRSDTGTS
ncbi:hypothetical protein CASFOL_029386 [Castilleja foliolosa]|uniref:CCHC-type domain-containing protein n=1 Tax=Castilleja foliolosa TaxID=1961234 RepID=A0ABD3CBV4_9LAMI